MKQDSISFIISAEEVVVNTTVKVVATIVAIQDMTEDGLREAIRELMQRFIAADWQFSGMSRTSHASGREQVTLTATARVPESENNALDRRSREASRDGLRIHTVNADTSPSPAQIEETQSELRQSLLKKALAELGVINHTLGQTYRLGRVIFDPDPTETASNRRPGMMAMAASYSSGFDHAGGGGAGEIGNAVKLTMRALVQLRRK